jgi:hypothetical protein
MPGGDCLNGMDFHHFLKIAGGIGALALFVPMAVEVVKDGGAGQSFATWLLWAALDTILTVSLFLQHGNYLLPLGFAAGGIVLTTLLLVKGRFAWDRMDNVILVLVLGCLIGWKLGGAKTATVAATLGICLAGIPGLVELWRNPQRKVGNIWGWYVLANGLAFLGGTAMTVEERFSPGVFAIYSLLMFVASRKPGAAKPPLPAQ